MRTWDAVTFLMLFVLYYMCDTLVFVQQCHPVCVFVWALQMRESRGEKGKKTGKLITGADKLALDKE